MVVRIIRSSKNQEGYKRWRAGNYASENPYAKEKASGPLSQGLFSKRVRTTGVRRFDDGAIRWCANLLATEESRLREVLDYIPRQYTCFHVRKRSGGFRYISAPAGDFRSMQQTIYHRILLLANIHPAVTGFCPGKSVSDNARVHLGRKNVLKVRSSRLFSFPYVHPGCRAAFREMGYSRSIAKVLAELLLSQMFSSAGSAYQSGSQ